MQKAVYGLRISPRAWGTERDSKLRNVTWVAEGSSGVRAPARREELPSGNEAAHQKHHYQLVQCKSDSQVWRIVQVGATSVEHAILGLLICYVDDFLLLCPRGAMRAGLAAALKEIWQITEVDLTPDEPFSFLGLEIERHHSGDLRIHQTTFTRNLLASYGLDLMSRPQLAVQVSHPRDDDGPPDATELRIIQHIVVSSTG